jgi:hypothetical protein
MGKRGGKTKIYPISSFARRDFVIAKANAPQKNKGLQLDIK